MYGTTPNPTFIRNTILQGSIGVTKVASDATIYPGYLIYMDETEHVAKPLDSDAHAANLLGAAYDQTPTESFGEQLSDFCYYRADGTNEIELAATPGETYYENTPVYSDGTPVGCTNVVGTNCIGYVRLKKGVTSVTAVAGTRIRIQLISPYAGV